MNHQQEDSNQKFQPYKKIVPAVMASDFADLEEKIERVRGLVERVQIDVMDGRFTDSVSWPYKRHAGMHSKGDAAKGDKNDNLDKNFRDIQKEVRGMPCWEDFDFEVDLMVSDPAEAVEEWASAGATRIILHLREDNTSDIREAIDIAARRGLLVSVAILPIPLSAIIHDFIFDKEVTRITGIQCMGIDKVGFQRQPFNPGVISLLNELRTEIDSLVDAPLSGEQGDRQETAVPMTLSVDGGVSFDTAGDLFEAGADYLVAGSAVYDADSVHQALDRFADISGE